VKALTICQPYAHLIMGGEKRVENRAWPTRYRGQIFIHAGKSTAWMGGWPTNPPLVFGAVVGSALLVDCIELSNNAGWPAVGQKYPWFFSHRHVSGPYCFVLDGVRRLENPIPYRGAQGFWNFPDHLVPLDTLVSVVP
jgi:hypothetical protein